MGESLQIRRNSRLRSTRPKVTSAFNRKGSSTEITLCAEVAGLTNISQSIPPWINEKIAGMLRVKRAYMNLVIQDDEGQTIYGHEVLKRIAQTGMTPEVNIVRGILPECFITYVSRRFPEVKEVRDLVASSEVNYKLLEAVSDRIELGVADVVSMFRLQSKVQAGSDE